MEIQFHQRQVLHLLQSTKHVQHHSETPINSEFSICRPNIVAQKSKPQHVEQIQGDTFKYDFIDPAASIWLKVGISGSSDTENCMIKNIEEEPMELLDEDITRMGNGLYGDHESTGYDFSSSSSSTSGGLDLDQDHDSRLCLFSFSSAF
jgi:hypothetical protein